MIGKIKEKPFLLLLFFACIFFVCGFIPTTETTDIQLHDTFLVIARKDTFIITSIFFILLFFIYFIIKKYLWSKKLIWMHVLFTFILSSILFFASPAIFYFRLFNEDDLEFAQFAMIYKINITALIILFFSQFLFLINIIAGVLKKSNPS